MLIPRPAVVLLVAAAFRGTLALAQPLCGQCEPVSGSTSEAVACGSKRAMSALVGNPPERFDVRSGDAVFHLVGTPVIVQGCRSSPTGCEKVFDLSLNLSQAQLISLSNGGSEILSCADPLTSIMYYDEALDQSWLSGADCTIRVEGVTGTTAIRGTFSGTLVVPSSLTVGGCFCSDVQSDVEEPDPCGAGIDVEKSDAGHAWGADQVIPYTISVANTGVAPLSGVRLTEQVPVNTTFSSDASTAGWSCTPGTQEGGVCTFDVGTLAANASRVVTFSTRVVEGTDPLWDVYNEVTSVGTATAASLARARNTQEASAEDTACQGTEREFRGCHNLPLTDNDYHPCCVARVYDAFATGGITFIEGCNNVLPSSPSLSPQQAGSGQISERLLYRVRDRVFRSTPGGRRATELYYDLGLSIVFAARSDPRLFDLGLEALLAWQPILAALVDGQGSSTTVDQAQVQSLLVFLDALRPATSARLQRAIDRGRTSLAPETWTGITAAEALARLDGLACPAAATYASVLCRLEELADLADGRIPAGRVGSSLAALFTKARTQVTAAEAATEARLARRALKKATGALKRLARILKSKKARREVEAGVRSRLLDGTAPLRADLKKLRAA